MSDNAIDTVDAAVLAQFLRECEPPTPPSSTLVGSSISSRNFFDPDFNQAPPEAFTSMLQLDEGDKQAILVALDRFSELNDAQVYPGNIQLLERDQNVTPVIQEDKALKLKLQRAKATKRRNRHRQRVKEEWQVLKLQDAQLSAKLEAIKRARVLGKVGISQLKWQSLASKELEARVSAEGQQLRFRVAIERRAAVMQNLQKVLDTQQEKNDRASLEWGVDDLKLYENFVLELTTAYARTDAVFNECGLAGAVPSDTSFYKPIRRQDVRSMTFFESTSAFVMPNEYPKSANAMFDAMRQIHRENDRRSLFETMENLSNTIAVKFGTVFHCEKDKIVPLNLITVLQRFVEPNRTVLVWRCLIEGAGEFGGTCLDETGWCMLHPTSTGSLNSTDVRTCIRSVPVHRGIAKTTSVDERDEAFANAVVRSSQQDSLKLAHLMDQLLIGV